MNSWWRENRWALVLLVPAIALALAAASFRYVSLYVPWFSDRAIDDGEVAVVHWDRFGIDYPMPPGEPAHVTPIFLRPVRSAEEPGLFDRAIITPAPGATLWQLEVEVEADPEMVLYGCTLALEDAAGTRYTGQPAKLRDGEPYIDSWGDSCIPQMTPGPGASLDNQYEPADPDSERPARYRVSSLFAVPEGVTPTRIRVLTPRAPHSLIDVPADL